MTARGTFTLRMPFSEYLALPSVHFSALHHVEVSPLHYLRAARESTDTAALRFGRALHAVVLTPDDSGVVLWHGAARRGREWLEFAREHADKTILTGPENNTLFGMRDAILCHPRARALLTGGDPEVTAEWTDAQTGLACRCRFDYLRAGGGIVELKTARASHPRAFFREAARRYYHAQLAMQADGYEACTGEPHASVHVIAVEKSPPYDVCVYAIGPETLDAGRRKVDAWLRVVAECTRTGTWPGAGGDADVAMQLPAWAESDGLEDPDTSGIENAEDDDGQA